MNIVDHAICSEEPKSSQFTSLFQLYLTFSRINTKNRKGPSITLGDLWWARRTKTRQRCNLYFEINKNKPHLNPLNYLYADDSLIPWSTSDQQKCIILDFKLYKNKPNKIPQNADECLIPKPPINRKWTKPLKLTSLEFTFRENKSHLNPSNYFYADDINISCKQRPPKHSAVCVRTISTLHVFAHNCGSHMRLHSGNRLTLVGNSWGNCSWEIVG